MNKLLLTKKVIGIDISDTSIKIIEARPKNGKAIILSYNNCQLKKGIIEEGELKDPNGLKIVLLELFKNAKPSPIKSTDICLGIPDYQVFNHYEPGVSMVKRESEEFAKEIATQNIPVDKDNMMMSHLIKTRVNESEKSREIFLRATYNDLVTKWENFFARMDLKLVSLVSSTSAAYFGMDKPASVGAYCLVDIGQNVSSENIIYKNCVIHSNSINNAGRLITENIAKSKKNADGESISEEDAEIMKLHYNPENANDQEIGFFVNNTIRTICLNIQASIMLCSSTKNICAYNIYLLGGSSKLNGLAKSVENFFTSSGLSLHCDSVSAENTNESKKEESPVLGTKAETISVKLASAKYLDSVNLDNTFLSSLGIVNTFFYNNNFSFDRDKINNLLKANIADTKKKKKEEGEIVENIKSSSWVKENSKLVALISIMLVGFLLLPVAFVYRKNNAKNKNADTVLNQPFSVKTNISLKIESSVDDSKYKPGMIKGKIFKTTINEPGKYDDVLKKAVAEANSKIKKHEKIWPEAINDVKDKEKLIFPLTFDFLLYNENDISAIVLKEGQERFGQKDFVLSERITSQLENDRANNKLFLTIDIIFLVNPGIVDKKSGTASSTNALQVKNNDRATSSGNLELVAEPDLNDKSSTTSSEIKDDMSVASLEQLLRNAHQNSGDYITVLNSSLGWVNTRKGPGTKFEITQKIYSGETYKIVSKENAWTKIIIAGTKEAWVSDKYIEKTKK